MIDVNSLGVKFSRSAMIIDKTDGRWIVCGLVTPATGFGDTLDEAIDNYLSQAEDFVNTFKLGVRVKQGEAADDELCDLWTRFMKEPK